MTFDFSVPITWADIINVISTVVALGAVIVAIVANCKASQSLKYSLKMQEQSKNIDLFEKRVAIIDEIKKDIKASELHIELLFDDDIADEYRSMMNCWHEHEDAYHDLNVYSDVIEAIDGEGGYTSPLAELADAEETLEKLNYPADKVKEFDFLCNKYQIIHSESDMIEDSKVYNYKDLSKRIVFTERQFRDKQEALLDMMQEFVKDSISPVDNKGGNSK